ncbi:hypothetical protein LP419_30750 [Massilia sp. H-1]|nr:hypothetical protein LP419_30750 [Massilia sp. H-1]
MPISLALLIATHAQAWDGQPNHYRLSINADASRAHVEAEVWVEGRELALFNVTPVAGLKNGQADFLEQLSVRDGAGNVVAVTDKGEGEYEVDGNRRLKLSYDVRLAHDQFVWPQGSEEVAYHTDEGLMATGYALFLVPGVAMHGQTRVDIDLLK